MPVPQVIRPGPGLDGLAQSIVPIIQHANLSQTGSDFISAKTGIIMCQTAEPNRAGRGRSIGRPGHQRSVSTRRSAPLSAWPVRDRRSTRHSTVWAFGGCPASSADFSAAITSLGPLSPMSRTRGISRGKTDRLHRTPAGFTASTSDLVPHILIAVARYLAAPFAKRAELQTAHIARRLIRGAFEVRGHVFDEG